MENVLTNDLLRGTVLDKFFGNEGFVSRKVKVKIIRRGGGWLPPEHEASVMMQDAKRIFCVPASSSTQQLVNPLKGVSPEQLDFLALKMGLKDREAFNIHLPKRENYWKKFEITLTRDGDDYDLGDPVMFLKWAVLRSDTDKIAPTWEERLMKGTYQFALIEDGEEDNQKLDRADKNKEAWRLYGRMETSEAKMRDFLWIYYLKYKDAQKPPKQATAKFLQTQVADIVENKIDRFLELAKDPDYETILLIHKAVDVKALARRKNKYFIGDDKDPIGGLQDMIEHLDDDRYQQDRLKIIHLVEKANEG